MIRYFRASPRLARRELQDNPLSSCQFIIRPNLDPILDLIMRQHWQLVSEGLFCR